MLITTLERLSTEKLRKTLEEWKKLRADASKATKDMRAPKSLYVNPRNLDDHFLVNRVLKEKLLD